MQWLHSNILPVQSLLNVSFCGGEMIGGHFFCLKRDAFWWFGKLFKERSLMPESSHCWWNDSKKCLVMVMSHKRSMTKAWNWLCSFTLFCTSGWIIAQTWAVIPDRILKLISSPNVSVHVLSSCPFMCQVVNILKVWFGEKGVPKLMVDNSKSMQSVLASCLWEIVMLAKNSTVVL